MGGKRPFQTKRQFQDQDGKEEEGKICQMIKFELARRRKGRKPALPFLTLARAQVEDLHLLLSTLCGIRFHRNNDQIKPISTSSSTTSSDRNPVPSSEDRKGIKEKSQDPAVIPLETRRRKNNPHHYPTPTPTLPTQFSPPKEKKRSRHIRCPLTPSSG